MLIITHRIRTSSEFMDRYVPSKPAGALFLPVKYGMRRGTHVCLEIVLTWLDETYFAYAKVERTDVAIHNCGREETGALVRFLDQEIHTHDTLLERVRQSAEEVHLRGDDRLSLDLGVSYFGETGRPRAGRIRDISQTGLFIESPRPLPAGSQVHLRIADDAHKLVRHIRGRVARLDFGQGVAGMGVEFVFPNRRDRKAVRRMCQHLIAASNATPSR